MPIWYPEHARGAFFYKKSWSEPQMNKNRQSGQSEHKREGNLYANKALTYALGLRSGDRSNWSCCHIWGKDDALYQETNTVVQDHRFYSCIANMVLLPTPLKAFTDSMQEVKSMLRVCAMNLYGWNCDHEDLAATISAVKAWKDWECYPKSWPRTKNAALPLGVMKLNDGIRQSASRRLTQFGMDLRTAGIHYPRDRVREALAYWKIEIPK